jgi:hypothetical protein
LRTHFLLLIVWNGEKAVQCTITMRNTTTWLLRLTIVSDDDCFEIVTIPFHRSLYRSLCVVRPSMYPSNRLYTSTGNHKKHVSQQNTNHLPSFHRTTFLLSHTTTTTTLPEQELPTTEERTSIIMGSNKRKADSAGLPDDERRSLPRPRQPTMDSPA